MKTSFSFRGGGAGTSFTEAISKPFVVKMLGIHIHSWMPS